jgi:histone deacetylase 11
MNHILHIVYDDAYNVKSLGPVGSRYAAILEHLKTLVPPDSLQIHAPASFALEASHDADYLASLDPTTLQSVFELSEDMGAKECMAIQEAQRLQYCGTLTAANLAVEHGFAVNLGGGLHHASRSAASGFCLYNDITAVTERLLGCEAMGIQRVHMCKPGVCACVKPLLEVGQNTSFAHLFQRVLIIDLDAHQGNGYEEDLWPLCQAGKVCIFDAYEPMIFPFPAGEAVKRSIHYFIPYLKDDRGDVFIEYLLKGIDKPFEEFQPDFVIYNAGTDTMEGDPVTKLAQTAEAIRDRDLLVVETCRRFGVPVMMCMSGGYGDDVPRVVAESLYNLSTKAEYGACYGGSARNTG